MEFRPGTVSAQEFMDRKGQCTSKHIALLVASPEFKRHQIKKHSRAGQGSLILVVLSLVIMFTILLAELLWPVGKNCCMREGVSSSRPAPAPARFQNL